MNISDASMERMVRSGYMNSVFDRYYQEYDEWYDRHKFAYLSELEALKKVLPYKGFGLEIGVGTGRFSAVLGINVGIDPSWNMVKIAQRRGVKGVVGIGEALPFKNGRFAYVVLMVTICFVENPSLVMQETKRVLRSGGRIIIGIVDKNSFLGRKYQSKKSKFYERANLYSPEEIGKVLSNTGFQKIQYYQTLFSFPEEMTSIDRIEKGSGVGGFAVITGEKR